MKKLLQIIVFFTSLFTIGISASENFDSNNKKDTESCDRVRKLQFIMQSETEQKNISAFQTEIYKKLNYSPELLELGNVVATFTDGVRTSVNSRVGYVFNVSGLCNGVENKKMFLMAPYVGKACNNAPEGKELACLDDFLARAKTEFKIGDKEIQSAIKKLQEHRP